MVISSTWRLGRTVEVLQRLMELRGFEGEVIGKTDCIDLKENWSCRGNEILKYIQDSEEAIGFYMHYNK